ncbi:MAG: hypothetical protein C4531_03865 [Desulfurivibrio sp.]|nr:MAG: hypothetical protein C4531_03865 [Desulfurivibrio sp.]
MNPYKKWVTRTLPLVAIAIAIFTLAPLSLLNMNFRDDSLCGKEYLLQKNPQLIFAGDSRAERQLNPLVASRLLHLDKDDVVNIAVTAGDPLMLEGLIDRYPEVFSQATVILSLSANLINDGAKGRKYFSTAMIAKLTVFEQISMLLPFDFRTWKNYYRSALYQVFEIEGDDCNKEYAETNGFYPVSGEIDVKVLAGTAENADAGGDKNTNHPWYMNYHSTGRKAQLLRQSLQAIAPRIGKLFVLTGPFDPSYLRSIRNSPLYEYEMDFETKLAAMCRELQIPFKSFTEHPLLGDQNFYDSAHLNAAGADLFTEIVIREFLDYREPATP